MFALTSAYSVIRELLRRRDDRQEQVGVIVVGDAIDDAEDAFQPHARIDTRFGQRNVHWRVKSGRAGCG